jgi:hypothetical protein
MSSSSLGVPEMAAPGPAQPVGMATVGGDPSAVSPPLHVVGDSTTAYWSLAGGGNHCAGSGSSPCSSVRLTPAVNPRAPVARQSRASKTPFQAVLSGLERRPKQREECVRDRQNLLQITRFWLSEAEGEGFEPSSDETARNGFRDRRIRPLCHPSAEM